jgi:hypothetical protein
VQRLETKETPAYTHEKPKEVEIKIEGKQTQRKSISECDQQNGKFSIGKQDMRKKEPRPPTVMRGWDRPIAEEYSPKLTLLQNSKVRSKCDETVVMKQMRVLTEFVWNKKAMGTTGGKEENLRKVVGVSCVQKEVLTEQH